MAFEKKPPEWLAEGSEPPASLKESGFQPGYKPPADYFNWFWHSVSEAIKELQEGAVPTSRTVNGKPLNADISISAEELEAIPKSEQHAVVITPTVLTSENAITAFYDNYSTSLAERTRYEAAIFHNADHSVFGGGLYYLFGVKGSDGYEWQEAKSYIGGGGIKHFVRSKANGAWSEWSEVYSAANKPTAADIGAVPASGGQISGNLELPWVRLTASNHAANPAAKFAILDTSGWIYHRTASEVLTDIGANPAPIVSYTDITAGSTAPDGRSYHVIE